MDKKSKKKTKNGAASYDHSTNHTSSAASPSPALGTEGTADSPTNQRLRGKPEEEREMTSAADV